MENNIKIERNNEFERQRKQEILKGNYSQFEIVISEKYPELPYIMFKTNNCSEKNIGFLIKALEMSIKKISIEHPTAKLFSDLYLEGKDK